MKQLNFFIMKKERPKLELKKRTIANLSNIEMSYVYGGGGDDEGGDVSRNHCDKTLNDDEIRDILKEAAKIAVSKLIRVC